jgi:glucose/arabinose dehydrogenase
VVGPDGAIFATDNDSESRNAGNSLFHIKRGEHYGFPYSQVSRTLSISGPIKSLDTNPNDVFEGLAYAAPGQLPAPYDDCLYVACLGSGQIKRVKLQREGSTYRAAFKSFARVPFPLDIVISQKETVMYVLSAYNQRKVYRIRSTGAKLDLVKSP